MGGYGIKEKEWYALSIVMALAFILLAGSAGAYPPPALLKIDGNEQTSGIGSNCWREENPTENQTGYICSDTAGIITPSEPLLARSPFIAHLRLPLQEPPEEVRFSATRVTNDDELKELANNVRVWSFKGSQGKWYNLPSERESDINLSLPPRLYVLNVDARWKEYGGTTYGFLVQVYNPAAEITTQATATESNRYTTSPNETHNIPTEKAAGFEAVLAIAILLALHKKGKRR